MVQRYWDREGDLWFVKRDQSDFDALLLDLGVAPCGAFLCGLQQSQAHRQGDRHDDHNNGHFDQRKSARALAEKKSGESCRQLAGHE